MKLIWKHAEVGASWVLWLSRLQSVWTCGFWVQSAPCASILQELWGLPLSLGKLPSASVLVTGYQQCNNMFADLLNSLADVTKAAQFSQLPH